jgi:phosphoribosylanthranilate isomerase
MVRVKICGLRRAEDVAAAVAAGADALGFNFWKGTARYVDPDATARMIRDVPGHVMTVGVFVDEEPERVLEIAGQAGLKALQLHGSEPPEYLNRLGAYVKIKAIKVDDGFDPEELGRYREADLFLLEPAVAGMVGGTGRTFDWLAAAKARKRGKIILAGGLTPENVADAVRAAHPWGVDVASGVESEPGIKDANKIRRFIDAARAAAT